MAQCHIANVALLIATYLSGLLLPRGIFLMWPQSELFVSVSPSTLFCSLIDAVTCLPVTKGTSFLCFQNGVVRLCWTCRKNKGGTGWHDWTRCLQMRKRLLRKSRHVHIQVCASGLYLSFNGNIIGVLAAFFHARLNSFLQEGSSQ